MLASAEIPRLPITEVTQRTRTPVIFRGKLRLATLTLLSLLSLGLANCTTKQECAVDISVQGIYGPVEKLTMKYFVRDNPAWVNTEAATGEHIGINSGNSKAIGLVTPSGETIFSPAPLYHDDPGDGETVIRLSGTPGVTAHTPNRTIGLLTIGFSSTGTLQDMRLTCDPTGKSTPLHELLAVFPAGRSGQN